MNLINSKKIENSKAINVFSNLSDYFIQIDYYDNKGIKKIKNNIPLKYILNKK
jgi:hypothetical protein